MGEPTEESAQPVSELEREIREGRKFTLANAIGRLAGPGMMKGVSPATGKQQADALIEKFLERHLSCPAGALSAVLLRQVKESEILLNNFDQPLVALASYVQRVLDSDYLLKDLVRQADCEWGRVYDERPYFDRPGVQPNENDPYTDQSTRTALNLFMAKLSHTIEEMA